MGSRGRGAEKGAVGGVAHAVGGNDVRLDATIGRGAAGAEDLDRIGCVPVDGADGDSVRVVRRLAEAVGGHHVLDVVEERVEVEEGVAAGDGLLDDEVIGVNHGDRVQEGLHRVGAGYAARAVVLNVLGGGDGDHVAGGVVGALEVEVIVAAGSAERVVPLELGADHLAGQDKTEEGSAYLVALVLDG